MSASTFPAVKLPKELRGQLTVSVRVAGRVLGIGRDAAYGAAARGDIPTLRIGRRLVVPVPQLLRMLEAAGPRDDDPPVDGAA